MNEAEVTRGVVRPVLAPICWPEHRPDPNTGTCVRCGKPSTVYDRYAHWYEEMVREREAETFREATEMVVSLLPKVGATIVDLACGPGLVSEPLVGDHRVIGVDASGPMIELARPRLSEVVNRPINSTMLPAGHYPVVMSTLSHTDLPWSDLVDEAYRLLEPGGMFVYVGVHPCFLGPHVRRIPGGGLTMFHGGFYGNDTRPPTAPDYSPDGIRARMGAKHLSLAAFQAPLFDRRWEGMTVIEGADLPIHIGVRVTRALPKEGTP